MTKEEQARRGIFLAAKCDLHRPLDPRAQCE